MKNKGPVLLLVGVVLLLLVTLWNNKSVRSKQSPIPEDPVIAEVTKAVPPSGSALPASGSDQRLPSVNQPLRLVVDRLEELARAGEPSAMCRLAMEYSFCKAERERSEGIRSRISALQERLTSGAGVADRPSMENELKGLRTVATTLGSGARHCEGVSVPDADERTNLLRGAALKGHVPSMGVYSRGEGFDWAEMFNQLDVMKRYRSEAERIAVEASKRGDLESVFALAAAYGPPSQVIGKSLLGQVVEVNPELSLSYWLQLRALYSDGARPDSAQAEALIERQVKSLSALLSSEEQARAQQQADARLADWKRPDKEARVFVTGITTSPSPNVLREVCDAGGDQVGSGVYIVPPER